MQFHALAHDAGRDDIILYQAPPTQKDQQHYPVRVTHEKGHAQNQQRGHQWAHDGDELHHAARGSQHQRVGNSY